MMNKMNELEIRVTLLEVGTLVAAASAIPEQKEWMVDKALVKLERVKKLLTAHRV